MEDNMVKFIHTFFSWIFSEPDTWRPGKGVYVYEFEDEDNSNPPQVGSGVWEKNKT